MYKVMIVDDMEIMRRQIKSLPLWGEETGFIIVDEASDGEEALEKLCKHHIDLLITDIKMPIINGIELLKEVKERNLVDCTIFLSDHREFTFAKKGLQYNVFDYLIKPVDMEELLQLLKRVKSSIQEKEIYYPTHQINSVAINICEGRKEAIDRLNILICDIFKILENNPTTINLVLEKAYYEILKEVQGNHKWIDKFIDLKGFMYIDIKKSKDINLLKKEIVERIAHLIILINGYILRSDNLELIKDICEYIVFNIEEEITIGILGEKFFLSKNYIGDLFKQETGINIGEYIINIKMERAKFLILENRLKIYEIAEKLNYKSVEYFSKTFKKYTGFTPGKFKEIDK